MIDISARLAAWHLYSSRGMVDQENTKDNQLALHQQYAERQLDDIMSGRIRISATMQNVVSYPTVEVEDEDVVSEEDLYYE